MRRWIVFGGVQGCFDEFMALQEKIGVTPEDIIIIAGDLIGWGPKPAECLSWVKQRRNVFYTEGNQDVEFDGHYTRGTSTKMWGSTFFTSQLLEKEGCRQAGEYFSRQPLAIATEYATIFHAAMDPQRALKDQDSRLLIGGIDVLEYQLREKLGKNWYEAYEGNGTIITAHRNYHWEMKQAYNKAVTLAMPDGVKQTDESGMPLGADRQPVIINGPFGKPISFNPQGQPHYLDANGKLLGPDGQPFVHTNANGGRVISLDTSGCMGQGKNPDQAGAFTAMVFSNEHPQGYFVSIPGLTDYVGIVRSKVTPRDLEGARLESIGQSYDSISVGIDRDAYAQATKLGVNRALDQHRATLVEVMNDHYPKLLSFDGAQGYEPPRGSINRRDVLSGIGALVAANTLKQKEPGRSRS